MFLTEVELARRSGVHAGVLSRWERTGWLAAIGVFGRTKLYRPIAVRDAMMLQYLKAGARPAGRRPNIEEPMFPETDGPEQTIDLYRLLVDGAKQVADARRRFEKLLPIAWGLGRVAVVALVRGDQALAGLVRQCWHEIAGIAELSDHATNVIDKLLGRAPGEAA